MFKECLCKPSLTVSGRRESDNNLSRFVSSTADRLLIRDTVKWPPLLLVAVNRTIYLASDAPPPVIGQMSKARKLISAQGAKYVQYTKYPGGDTGKVANSNRRPIKSSVTLCGEPVTIGYFSRVAPRDLTPPTALSSYCGRCPWIVAG